MKHKFRLLLILTLGWYILSAHKIVDTSETRITDFQKEMIDVVFNGTCKILKGIVESSIDYTRDDELSWGVISLPDNIDENEIKDYFQELVNMRDSIVAQTDVWNGVVIDSTPFIRCDYTIMDAPVQILYIKTDDRNDLIFIVSKI